MNLRSKLADAALVLVTPESWTTVGDYDKEQDAWLRDALKNPVFQEVNAFTILLNGKLLWYRNEYFACGCTYNNSKSGNIPSRATMIRFTEAVKKFKESNAKRSQREMDIAIAREAIKTVFEGSTLEEVEECLKEKYPERFI